jgi:hypothetical protein
MQCKLTEVTHKVWPGRTFFTTSVSGGMRPAAVYMPPNHNESSRALNVLMFFHGFYVGSKEDLINSDNTRLCEQVLMAGRDVVLVAPWLGAKWGSGSENGTLQTDLFGEARYGQRFLRAILDALPDPSAPVVAAPAPSKGVDAISGAGPIVPRWFSIKNLVVACHSAGGAAMLNVVDTLGDFESKLRECIGLDCFYGSGDAKFWFDRAQKNAPPTYIFFGPSTIPQSIKLYLMAKGRADAFGNQRDPPGQTLDNIKVRPGHFSSYLYGGVANDVSSSIDRVIDDLIARPPPPSAPAKSKIALGSDFASQAAMNFAANYIFPVSDGEARGGIHYFIARAFLRERLNNVRLA